MTPQLLIASAELLGMDVAATFRRALGHGVGFRSLDEEARFEALLNDATAAKPSRWRTQSGAYAGRDARSDFQEADVGPGRATGAPGGASAPFIRGPRTMEEARFAVRGGRPT